MKQLSSLLFASIIAVNFVALTNAGIAQTSETSSPKTGTRLVTLGTQSGPTPRAHRAQSSNLLIVNGVFYLVDAGDGVARRLATDGINIRDIGTIFITHHHDDHTAGLGTLMSVAWNNQRTKAMNVYGPPRTEDLVKAVLRYLSFSAEIRLADGDGGRTVPIDQIVYGHDVGTGVIYQDANVKVTAVENSHFAFHRGPAAGKYKSYSYRFEMPDRVIVFTGNTGASDAVSELAKGADLLVTETVSVQDRIQLMINDGRWQSMTQDDQAGFMRQATQGHMTPEIIGKMATRANVKTVLLTHLTLKLDNDYTPVINLNNLWSAAPSIAAVLTSSSGTAPKGHFRTHAPHRFLRQPLRFSDRQRPRELSRAVYEELCQRAQHPVLERDEPDLPVRIREFNR